MRTIIRDLATVAAAAPLRSPPAVAQPRTAALTGTVVAADGARLPGVTLRVRGPEAVVETSSGEAGQFRIAGLPPGSDEVTAGLEGFEPLRISDVALAAGESRSLNLRLEVAALHESIRVVGEARRDSVEAFEMRESRARDVGEALAAVPGITKVRKGAIANDVVIRGFQGKDVTVLIDGQRLDGACPGRMDPPAFHVDFAEVSRVEVSKGPFDVRNQGGLAGIANIVTERPLRGVHGAANVTVAAARTLATSASGSVRHDRWALLAGASTRRANPYEDGDGRPMTDSAGYRPTIERDIRTRGNPARAPGRTWSMNIGARF